uniref:Uncharacterized protein n=1 Tax=Ditylenchus dipsaci TaxID=166011 RepID=A0A915E2P1_9BILA
MEKQVPSRAVSSGTEATMTQKTQSFRDKSRVDLKRMQGNVQEQAISSKEAPRAILRRAIESVDEDSRPLIRRYMWQGIFGILDTQPSWNQQTRRLCKI